LRPPDPKMAVYGRLSAIFAQGLHEHTVYIRLQPTCASLLARPASALLARAPPALPLLHQLAERKGREMGVRGALEPWAPFKELWAPRSLSELPPQWRPFFTCRPNAQPHHQHGRWRAASLQPARAAGPWSRSPAAQSVCTQLLHAPNAPAFQARTNPRLDLPTFGAAPRGASNLAGAPHYGRGTAAPRARARASQHGPATSAITLNPTLFRGQTAARHSSTYCKRDAECTQQSHTEDHVAPAAPGPSRGFWGPSGCATAQLPSFRRLFAWPIAPPHPQEDKNSLKKHNP
jgi:hypothetical protein